VTDFLLIPGGGSDPSYWQYVVAELALRGHRGVPIDLPCEDASADLHAYADAVAAQHTPGATRPVVVAHSLGGFTGPLACPRVDAAALVYVSAMLPRSGERPGDWWEITGCAAAQRAAADIGGYDADDMDALFYNGVDPVVVASVVERQQSDTPMVGPWPGYALPELPTRFVLFADDRFFPESFMRATVAQRLGIEPEAIPGGHMAMLSHPGELADRLVAAIPSNS
jgi:pimeloyl-ACP methyl ester carboxylesterase